MENKILVLFQIFVLTHMRYDYALVTTNTRELLFSPLFYLGPPSP